MASTGQAMLGLDGDQPLTLENLANAVYSLAENTDVFYSLFCGATIFLMQSGFTFLHAGSIQEKNVKNILIKSILHVCGGAIGYWATGFGVAFEKGTFIGTSGDRFFLKGNSSGGSYYIDFFIQFTFAVVAASITAGVIAERCKMVSYICYSIFFTGFLYPVVVHAIWNSDGFLSPYADKPLGDVGMIDFSGSGVIHVTGGATGLVATIILGPRIGRFYDKRGQLLDKPYDFPSHSVILQVLGTFILWFGWYGLNAGSTFSISPDGYGDVAALCTVTTTLSAAAGALSSMFTDTLLGYYYNGEIEYDLNICMNGCLGGLVAISAGCAVVEPWAAVIIGIVSGYVYLFSSKLLVHVKVDDASDAIPIHFFNGIWGCISTGLFACPRHTFASYGRTYCGLFYSNKNLLLAEICGILFIVAWVSAVMTPLFYIVNMLGLFRIEQDEEIIGIDISLHKGPAYNFDHSSHEDSLEKPRILAIHGKASNSAITKLQLANLEITDDKFDITYLDGLVEMERGGKGVEEFVNGPYFSFYHDKNDHRFSASFMDAVIHVQKTIIQEGPFDAIYGFSQGGCIAAAVAAAHNNIDFRDRLLEHEHGRHGSRRFKSSLRVSGNFIGSGIDRTSKGQGNLSSRSDGLFLSPKSFYHAPCKYIILACTSEDPAFLNEDVKFPKEEKSVDIPSFHLIGVKDSLKSTSEKMTQIFSDAHIMYLAGGHSISRVTVGAELLETLHQNLYMRKNVVTMSPPKMVRASDVSSIGVMSPNQVVGVELSNLIDNPTILDVLKSKDPSRPLLYNARDSFKKNFTTYGEVVEFIEDGEGDLRRLGVKKGDVVAYCAPPGGGAVPALALLSIMSQVTAAPFAPSTTESDARILLEQFSPTHLILFDGVENQGVKSAFLKFVAANKTPLHRACMLNDPAKPGLFRYYQSSRPRRNSLDLLSSTFHRLSFSVIASVLDPLHNPVDGIALLLGTSGTTSKPKAVPINQESIVQNAHILGRSIGLKEDDVCYSVMPLFHIGGISASILCSICAGASICCDAETYKPENMVDALATSNPQPTWYSSVPTIHNATVSFIQSTASGSRKIRRYGISKDGIWKSGHSLRFIRSGAAALLPPDAKALSSTFGNIPIIPTYSMSEQMPITQPVQGKTDMISDKPGSVGVPVATSLAIVNSATFTPVPFGVQGEVAICGPNVIENYLDNPDANSKSYFELTLPLDARHPFQRGRYFLTGDVGVLDTEGNLTLTGRNKELIKKGGEQVSPFEIEEPVIDHPWIEVAVCFAVPSELYGEEVGLALVLSDAAPSDVKQSEVVKNIRDFLKAKNVSSIKFPTKWKIVSDNELPKTKSNKYIRVGLAKTLGFEADTSYLSDPSNIPMGRNNTFIDWEAISGFRFLLACYVMFMHIGSNSSWGSFNNLRGWPWHVHVFFLLGGFSLVAPMNPVIEKKFKYFMARFMGMYPMYIVALVFVFINLLVACRPSTFRSSFHWDSQPDDLFIDGKEENGYSDLFCEGAPATPHSYWASLFLSLVVYLFGVAITPLWLLNWWVGYYFWFSAMYYQCLLVFPIMYNKLTTWRSNVKFYSKFMACLQGINIFILLLTWLLFENYSGYNHYDENGNRNDVENFTDGRLGNWIGLGWYLFSPFWILYFVIGACAAFLYDAYRPAEKSKSYRWGYVADGCTILMIIWSIAIVCQGNISNDALKTWKLRPDTANNYTDVAIVNRLWDNICGRLVAPITTLWIFALATGKGWTASILGSKILTESAAPHAYNCFLFHQPVAQWYFAATRKGLWWNWWSYRKTMYWFSPAPCPVQWYEYFFLVILTVGFSSLMKATAEPWMANLINYISERIVEKDKEEDTDVSIEDLLVHTVEDMTGIAPELDWTLDQCGLSSVGLPQLAMRIKNTMSSKTNPINITAGQLNDAKTLGDICRVIENTIAQSNADGI